MRSIHRARAPTAVYYNLDRLVVAVCHLAPAVTAFVVADLTYPYYTVSDMIGTQPGLRFVQPGLLLQVAWFAYKRRRCTLVFIVGSLFPLFRLQHPIVMHPDALDARDWAHLAWACVGATSMTLIAPTWAVLASSVGFGLFYGTGMLLQIEPFIIVGCLFEWTLFYLLPLVYITPRSGPSR